MLLRTLQTFCCNLARQKRVMCNHTVDFDTLLNLASIADQQFHSISPTRPSSSSMNLFTRWTMNYAASSILRIIRLGFDLELYDDHEYLSANREAARRIFPDDFNLCLHRCRRGR